MDRRVKERLIGATILVVLIVLIVPELLSGPKRPVNVPPPLTTGPAEPVRNVTVDLATSKATPGADAPASSAAAPAASGEVTRTAPSGPATPGEGSPRGSASGEPEPGPSHRAATPPTILTLQAQQPVTPALENDAPSPRSAPAMPKPAIPREPAPPSGSHHNWAVQLGSFANSANAEKLARQLKGQSFSAYVSSSGAGRSLRYRVRIGPMADRAAADRVIARLRNEGHSASVVAP